MEYALGGVFGIACLYFIKSTLRKRALRFRNADVGRPSPEFDEVSDHFMCIYQSDGTTRFGLSREKNKSVVSPNQPVR